MGPICDRWNEHLGTSDIAVIAMRRRLIQTAQALARGEEPAAATRGSLYGVRPLDIITRSSELADVVEQHGNRMRPSPSDMMAAAK
jgi:hypothetical protein